MSKLPLSRSQYPRTASPAAARTTLLERWARLKALFHRRNCVENHCSPCAADPFPNREAAKAFWLRLMSLPLEVRELVYAAKFAHLPPTTMLRCGNDANLARYMFPALLPPWCYVDQQVFRESAPVFFASRAIVVRNDECLRMLCEFLDRIPEQRAYRRIRVLHVEGYTRLLEQPAPYSSEARLRPLFAHCEGLRYISVEVHAWQFGNHSIRAGLEHIEPLARMLKLRFLAALELRCVGWEFPRGVGLEDIFKPAIDWLEAEIGKAKWKGKLVVKYVSEESKWPGSYWVLTSAVRYHGGTEGTGR